MTTTLYGKDILDVQSLTDDEVHLIMETAARYERVMKSGGRLLNMDGKTLATLFYEPSTRTRLSFETAMLRLGGTVLSVADAKTSSSSKKGETIYDTGKMIEGYADVAVIRHPETGSAAELAAGSSKPVINGGDGAGQHPTQALLDLYTIIKEKGKTEGLTVCLAGDLKNGRTVHSGAALLARMGVKFIFTAPEALAMPASITEGLKKSGVEVEINPDLDSAVAKSDVLYMTRIQKERFEDPEEYERLKTSYEVTNETVKKAKKGMIIMHPLPRVTEIAVEVDAYEGAAYFRQAANGVPVRMALLALVCGCE
ncbi:aspartate carbamoyltransferase [Flexilinea flocculi]|jgi:aspartate carbamoyltransferase|uniref:Aspartate carbamoyltransferase n=2 Tax=Flexilinea flocculi TaxID=1678840 RepID=A0A0K8PB31_9CHLR|nr:aspartate carbamoyltransferase [Flexilinea flocculi]GAP39856.1 aspartate carbamoyltransferase [Flexilinea flocculi]